MKDHQLGYTLPLHPLGAKRERHQATPEDRRAIELCKFEQKRHEVEPIRPKRPSDWIAHWATTDGENPPVDSMVQVDVLLQFADGIQIDCPDLRAGAIWWGALTDGSKIVAYRVRT